MARSFFWLNQRCARLNQLCAGGRPLVRRVPPDGRDVTIGRGPHDDPVDLVVEADWSPGCCVSWDCPGEPEGWEFGKVWVKRRGTWRSVETLTYYDWRQIERELGGP